ncbi:MAG: hypothetical protein JNL12_08625 [Planctomycetes bacterium]|nr:hypothetical protein [Planctomycetota bacterium]
MLLRPSLACLAALATSACAVMPRELNLAPLWFHRCDEQGEVLEWDLAWPIVHYERTPAGGDDFRIRPLYRRVTEPEPGVEAVEHQFLWPLGRVRSYPEETSARLFPLWSWRSRPNEDGERDVDWYALFPFLWGGWSADDRENYFAVFPLFADIPDFLTYDRFRCLLFPLYVNVDKGGHRHHLLPWPLVGFSTCAEGDHSWFRILPLYGHDIETGRHDRRFVLWPFFTWSTENEDSTTGPVHAWSVWPFFGRRWGADVHGWHVLWPLFQLTARRDHFFTLNVLWPFFKYHWNRATDNLTQWWLWPFYSRVTSDDQRAWTFAWPLVWWREYDDPDGHTEQQWILPFFWHVRQERKDGGAEDFTKLWPLWHRTADHDGSGRPVRGDFSLPSPFPWRDGNAYGVEEAYGWLWQWVRGVRRGPDDDALDVFGRLYTQRERADGTTASVPFLGSYERDRSGARTLRLLHFLPIPLGGGDEATAEPNR